MLSNRVTKAYHQTYKRNFDSRLSLKTKVSDARYLEQHVFSGLDFLC